MQKSLQFWETDSAHPLSFTVAHGGKVEFIYLVYHNVNSVFGYDEALYMYKTV